MDDRALDALFPRDIRRVSEWTWTKVSVARRAGERFVEHGAERVLDVGSGCGKFCIAVAAAFPLLELVGCERDAALVAAAVGAAQSLSLPNVRFVVGDATGLEWSEFDGIYLFRPFDDEEVHLVRRVERAFETARLGTTVVTFNRFGGRIPLGWELASEERIDWNWLRTWVKRRPLNLSDGFWLEQPSGAVRVLPR